MVADSPSVRALIEAQEMFDKFPYLTRMYSTVSPEEMDRDPIFEFNASLEDVSNAHEATLVMTCEEGGVSYEIELSNGETFAPVAPEWWDLTEENQSDAPTVDAETEPAASSIELMGSQGEPRTVQPQDAQWVDEQLNTLPNESVDVPAVSAQTPPPPEAEVSSPRSGGCSSTGGGLVGTGYLLALMLLLAVRRRSGAGSQA